MLGAKKGRELAAAAVSPLRVWEHRALYFVVLSQRSHHWHFNFHVPLKRNDSLLASTGPEGLALLVVQAGLCTGFHYTRVCSSVGLGVEELEGNLQVAPDSEL